MKIKTYAFFFKFFPQSNYFINMIYCSFFRRTKHSHDTKHRDFLISEIFNSFFQNINIHSVIIINLNGNNIVKSKPDNFPGFYPRIVFSLWNNPFS